MNDYIDFDKDLRDGQAREDAFVHVMLRSRVEHKRDKKFVHTGNFAVEFEQRNREGVIVPSGVDITASERWAIEFHPECWLVLPTEFVRALKDVAVNVGKDVWIGNGLNHHNALIPVGWFFDRKYLKSAAWDKC